MQTPIEAVEATLLEYSGRVFSYEGRVDCARPIAAMLRRRGALKAVLARLGLARTPERASKEGAGRALRRLGVEAFDQVLDLAFDRCGPLSARPGDLAAVAGREGEGLACGIVGVGVVYVFDGETGALAPVSLANAVRAWRVV